MESLVWSNVAAIVGSVAVVCLTIIRIMGSKRRGGCKELSDLKEKVASVSEDTAVQASKIKTIEGNIEHLQSCFDKQNDLFLKLITEK